MSYYRECPICGSNLDPGEQCTCAEDRRKEQSGNRSCTRSEHMVR